MSRTRRRRLGKPSRIKLDKFSLKMMMVTNKMTLMMVMMMTMKMLLQVSVTIVDDNQWEPDEEFFLKLALLPKVKHHLM